MLSETPIYTADESVVCHDCLVSSGGNSTTGWSKTRTNLTIEQIRTLINKKCEVDESFSATKAVKIKRLGFFVSHFIVGEFDDNNKSLKISETKGKGEFVRPYLSCAYDDLMSYELVDGGGEVYTSGGLGSAITGGIFLGGAGAIAGAAIGKKTTTTTIRKLRIKIALRNMNLPLTYIDLFNTQSGEINLKINSTYYADLMNEVRELFSAFDLILEGQQRTQPPITTAGTTSSIINEIAKLNALLTENAITNDEYELLKSNLLKGL
jgi:hypothetical protein